MNISNNIRPAKITTKRKMRHFFIESLKEKKRRKKKPLVENHESSLRVYTRRVGIITWCSKNLRPGSVFGKLGRYRGLAGEHHPIDCPT